jgi:hypothetical protein
MPLTNTKINGLLIEPTFFFNRCIVTAWSCGKDNSKNGKSVEPPTSFPSGREEKIR